MFTWQFEVLVFVAAFILGTLEGQNLKTWLKSWFSKKVAVLEGKTFGLTPVTGHTGPNGPEGKSSPEGLHA